MKTYGIKEGETYSLVSPYRERINLLMNKGNQLTKSEKLELDELILKNRNWFDLKEVERRANQ